jgi:hypothetical protein
MCNVYSSADEIKSTFRVNLCVNPQLNQKFLMDIGIQIIFLRRALYS